MVIRSDIFLGVMGSNFPHPNHACQGVGLIALVWSVNSSMVLQCTELLSCQGWQWGRGRFYGCQFEPMTFRKLSLLHTTCINSILFTKSKLVIYRVNTCRWGRILTNKTAPYAQNGYSKWIRIPYFVEIGKYYFRVSRVPPIQNLMSANCTLSIAFLKWKK